MKTEIEDSPVHIQQDLIWSDMDAYQHVNNAVYFRYFEDARMAYFEKIGVNTYMSEHQVGPILASTSADFKAPLNYPDTISIAARITDIHAKKFTMLYSVYSHNLNKVVAKGSCLIVYFDYSQGRSCEIPNSILKQINSLENR